jgi:hypothetical protein
MGCRFAEVENGTGHGFEIEVVGTDGRVWKSQCLPAVGKASIVGRGIGIQDYATMSACQGRRAGRP